MIFDFEFKTKSRAAWQPLHMAADRQAADLNFRTAVVNQYRSHPESWYQWAFEHLELPENGRVLELGCGPADLWAENWSLVSPDWEIYMSDSSLGMVREAASRIQQCFYTNPMPSSLTAGQFHYTVSEAGAIPFAEQEWDIVLAFGLLDLVADREKALGEIRRTLKPGGKIYASAGGRIHLIELAALISPFLPHVQFGGNPSQFGLSNGQQYLTAFFEDIVLYRYLDEMVFREAEPIVAFALSEAEVREQLSEEEQLLLHRCLTQLIIQRGELRVTTEKGIFKGSRPK
jgi:ubiquinone/menaquinone biosynthesis C-methylase UbiE